MKGLVLVVEPVSFALFCIGDGCINHIKIMNGFTVKYNIYHVVFDSKSVNQEPYKEPSEDFF